MSSKSTKTPSPLQSTRQMLDELDSLMERMLALPVGDSEELAPLPRDVRPIATISASLTLPDDPPESPTEQRLAFEEKKVPLAPPRLEPAVRPARRPSFTEQPAVPAKIAEPATRPREALADAFDEQLPPPLPINRPVQYVTSPASPRPVRYNPLLLPFVWVNQSFDVCTSLLGPIGRGLRSMPGRTLLGLVGLVCLGAASAWAILDHVGWP